MAISDNILFIINSSQEIVFFNEKAKEAFPNMKLGEVYTENIGMDDIICDEASLCNPNGSPIMLYNANIYRWIQFTAARADLPEFGPCSIITGSFYANMDRELLARMKLTTKYDYLLELDLTLDRYLVSSQRNFGQPVKFEEESLSKLLKRTAETMVHPDDKERFKKFVDLRTLSERLRTSTHALADTFRERSSRGNWDNVTATFIPEDTNNPNHEIAFLFFSIEKIDENEMNLTKYKDPLTGLITKDRFITEAQEFVKKTDKEICLISIDVEHFRFFNKWYSRWQGDRLLKQIAFFLDKLPEYYNSLSGYGGGDNFFLICENNSDVLDFVVDGLNELITDFEGIEGFKMSYGGYKLQNKNEEILDAIDYATTAANRDTSQSAERILWYSSEIEQEVEHELKILPDIERGLQEGEFTFYLQPKCSIEDNKIVGAEALVRWKHKIKGMVSPGQFIPVLEKTGMITKLDAYIWEEVCKQLRVWIDKGLKPVPISVNVSRIDIFNLNVPKVFAELVKKYDLDPKLIEIEVTESSFTTSTQIIQSVIQRLRGDGFAILIDDFGSGYSSLNMLKEVQADVLKMDIKFFDLDENNFDKGINIITSVLDMSHNINLPVIAEGVETQEQIDILKNVGLNYVQGYYYYKPIPIDEYEKLIEKDEQLNHNGMKIKQ